MPCRFAKPTAVESSTTVNEPSLTINELFYSIQGESSYAGLPCFFIRLSGCNLRCRYCDSGYSWEEPGEILAVREIADRAAQYPGVITEITGGEPLLQEGVHELISRLETNHLVLLETNGSCSLEGLSPRTVAIIDVKCPGSGMEGRFHPDNLELLLRRKQLGARDEIKFVLGDEEDFLWAKNFIHDNKVDQLGSILFSPIRATFPPEKLAGLILKHRLAVRLQLQLHTIIWPRITRGV